MFAPMASPARQANTLQVTVEDGAWHTVTLTLTGLARFVEAFRLRFGGPLA